MRLAYAAAVGLAAFVFAVQPADASSSLERGRYLMNAVAACGNCHTPFGPQGPDMSREMAGRVVEDSELWTAIAPNLTPDTETGIGAWSDAEIARAIREGVRPDGTVLGPPMAFGLYRHISDDDIAAIIAYLRQLPAVKSDLPRSTYHVPTPPSWGPPITDPVTAPDRSDLVAYGGYLAGPMAHCMECHSTPGANGAPDLVNELGGGGFAFHGPWGTSVSANLTPAGLGDWSDAEIARAIRTGVSKDGRMLMPPMGYGFYANISDGDMTAIIAYLRSLPEK